MGTIKEKLKIFYISKFKEKDNILRINTMGNSQSTHSTQYYITISKSPLDDDTEPLILYSNLTTDLDSIQDFLLGNSNSKTSKNLKKEIDNWFETNKKALDELQEDNLEYEKRRKVPVTLYDINMEKGLYNNFYPGIDDDEYERAERITDEKARYDREIVKYYSYQEDPFNDYIDSGFLECNTITDFFDKSKYEERYNKISYTHPKESTGLEYFFLFFARYMNKDFCWKGNKYSHIPLKITLKVRYDSLDFKSRKIAFGYEKMYGLSPKNWRQSKKVFKETPPENTNKMSSFVKSLTAEKEYLEAMKNFKRMDYDEELKHIEVES